MAVPHDLADPPDLRDGFEQIFNAHFAEIHRYIARRLSEAAGPAPVLVPRRNMANSTQRTWAVQLRISRPGAALASQRVMRHPKGSFRRPMPIISRYQDPPYTAIGHQNRRSASCVVIVSFLA